MEDGSCFNLPPGFLFSPSDEELVLHFLYSKASLIPCHPNIIPDLDPSTHLHPCQLNGTALLSGNQYYFFTKVNENRTIENGCWKEIGVTEPILSTFDKKVGMKKYLVFHVGESPTSWVMQEYHICSSGFDETASYGSARKREKHDQSWSKWVLCRVYEKGRSQVQDEGVDCYYRDDDDGSGSELSWLDQVYLSLDDDLEEFAMSIN